MSQSSTLPAPDYYAILNINRWATEEEIKAAYYRLSRIVHPDKHRAELSEAANANFALVERAYKVLSDPVKRWAFDKYGEAGLEQVMTLANKDIRPEDIGQRFERLIERYLQDSEEQRFRQSGTFRLGVSLAEFVDQTKPQAVGPQIDISQMFLDHNIQAPLSSQDTLFLGGHMVGFHGLGSGAMSVALRRVFSADSWAQLDGRIGSQAGADLKLWRKLSANSFGQMDVAYDNRGGFSLVTSVSRQLAPDVLGSWTFKPGPMGFMQLAVRKRTSTWSWDCKLTTGMTSLKTECGVSKDIGSKSRLGVVTHQELTALNGGLDFGLEVRATHQISSRSKGSVGVSYGSQGVSINLRYQRGLLRFVLPIQISARVSLKTAVAATLLPIVIITAVHRFTKPARKARRLRKDQKRLEERQQYLQESRDNHKNQLQLIAATVERVRKHETEHNGLIILKARYGDPIHLHDSLEQYSPDDNEAPVINVTDALQFAVKDSELELPATSKSGLYGFYNPCFNTKVTPKLYISYRLRDQPFELLVEDDQWVKIQWMRRP
eukprot:GILJ01003910.1.p1 GENE.GILJ01003910.1~~GILJ01003910.1.p1  ORF type:complete len:549 (+),score=67.83 GILJ01003910.1:49-1695(+)